MVKEKLTELEFEILELFRDGQLCENDNDYKMIYSDQEKSSFLFSLLENSYLEGYWNIDKVDIFYIKMTTKGIEYYKNNKKMEEELTELELEILGIIEHYGGEPLTIYEHFVAHRYGDDDWDFLQKLEQKKLIAKEWRSSHLYYVLTAKAKDYLWLEKSRLKILE